MTDLEMVTDYVALHGAKGARWKNISLYMEKLGLKIYDLTPNPLICTQDNSGIVYLKNLGRFIAIREGNSIGCDFIINNTVVKVG